MAGDLASIGAVTVDYRRPSLRWTSEPTTHGIRPGSLSGTVDLTAGLELSELAANQDDQTTVGGFTGVRVDVVFTGDVLSSFSGDYLLQSFNLEIEHQWMFGGPSGPTPFSLNWVYLGDLA